MQLLFTDVVILQLFLYPPDGLCPPGDVRLSGGNSDDEGRVEICINGVWGTICNPLWGEDDARVVCGQLGYSSSGQLKQD